MYFKGNISFKISHSSDFNKDINEKTGFEPTSVIKKGTQITSQRTAPYNIWSYAVNFDDSNFSAKLSCFTSNLLQYRSNILALVSEYDCIELNFYINTQYGQFGFSIPHKELAKISTLGINVNFHFLSAGEVIE